MREVTVSINGISTTATIDPRLLLSDFLRHELGLTGTHVGCEHGYCGSCTVLVDGQSARSCLTLAVQLAGHKVETVESLSNDGELLHPIQQAFKDCHGLQCGFCTPGLLMSVKELAETNAEPDRAYIREHLAGNICRCTGYHQIVDAVQQALGQIREGQRHD